MFIFTFRVTRFNFDISVQTFPKNVELIFISSGTVTGAAALNARNCFITPLLPFFWNYVNKCLPVILFKINNLPTWYTVWEVLRSVLRVRNTQPRNSCSIIILQTVTNSQRWVYFDLLASLTSCTATQLLNWAILYAWNHVLSYSSLPSIKFSFTILYDNV